MIVIQKQIAAQQRASDAVDAERREEQKRMMAHRAYQQWLANKKREQQQQMKERRIEQELRALQEEQQEVDKERARMSFSSWKRRKDLEKLLKDEDVTEKGREDTLRVGQTPMLPGYCSVWSCDEELADHMLARVYRYH